MNHQTYVDIVVTAIEGGIDYWADLLEYNPEQYPDAIHAVIQEMDGDSGPVTLTQELVQAGFDKIVNGDISLRGDILDQITRTRATGEWEGDSEAADCIIQAAVLGDVIYS